MCFLTGAQARKTDGTDIRAGISVDQLAATRLGDRTRLPSLEIGCEHARRRATAIQVIAACIHRPCHGVPPRNRCLKNSIRSWCSSDCSAPEPAPRRAQRDARSKSILDFVREDSKDLSGKLGSSDVRKLDEYLSHSRHRNAHCPGRQAAADPNPNYGCATEIPAAYDEHSFDVRLDGAGFPSRRHPRDDVCTSQ